MHASSMHYFPVTAPFMLLLGVLLAVVITLIELGAITYAYEKIGIRRQFVFLVLLGTLLGSAVNIPIAEFPARDVKVAQVVQFLGVQYVVPQIEHHDKTVLAVNLGGALIPLGISIYLLVKNRVYVEAAIAVAIVAAITNRMAWPVPGVGIAISPFVAPITAAVVAVIISRRQAAPIAYIAGSVGTLLGADILNLYKIQALGAPIASIGGAGIGDGVFLAGIVAVLLA